MKTRYIKHFLFLFIGLIISQLSSAQPSAPKKDGDRKMFVEIVGLNPANYESLSKAMDGRENIAISSACVPASIVMLSLPASNEENLDSNFTTFRDIVFDATGLKTVKVLAEYSEESFLNRCKQFRGSGQP